MEKKKNPPSKALVAIGTIGDIFENIYIVLGGIILVVFFLSVVADVGARTLNNSLFWTQDAAIFSYFWCIFVAAAICTRRNEHFSIELFQKMPKVASIVKKLIIIVMMGIFTFYTLKYGWDYALMCWTRKQSGSGLRLFYAILAMPVSGVGFAWFIIEQAVLLFTGRELPEISKKHAKKEIKEG